MDQYECGEMFKRLFGIVIQLRSENGCPWDREQSPQTLRSGLIEECYECIEAIDENNPAHIREELGDIFLLAAMISYMYQEEGVFSITDVLNDICEKLIRRHPHVFNKCPPSQLSSEKVLENWERIKVEQEGRKPKSSVLDDVSRALPPLDRAWKLQKKAAKLGFDWPSLDGVLTKLKEELAETEAALPQAAEKIEEELGDLLFSVVNLCRFVKVDPTVALQRTNTKFIRRFGYVEKKMKESGTVMKAENLELMDQFWNEAKTSELKTSIEAEP